MHTTGDVDQKKNLTSMLPTTKADFDERPPELFFKSKFNGSRSEWKSIFLSFGYIEQF